MSRNASFIHMFLCVSCEDLDLSDLDISQSDDDQDIDFVYPEHDNTLPVEMRAILAHLNRYDEE